MNRNEEFDWYTQTIAAKRKALDKLRQEFFQLDFEVSRLERERAVLFRQMFDEAGNRPLTNGNNR